MKKNTINVWSYLEEYEDYEEEILQIVKEVFNSGRLILGENVKSFEQEFSKWVGNGYGTGVGNGTDAIKLALMSLGGKNGDEVITYVTPNGIGQNGNFIGYYQVINPSRKLRRILDFS